MLAIYSRRHLLKVPLFLFYVSKTNGIKTVQYFIAFLIHRAYI
jgi:hypothetical protein